MLRRHCETEQCRGEQYDTALKVGQSQSVAGDLIPGTKEKVIQDVQERLVLILSKVPGLRVYSPVEVGDNEVAVTGTFNTFAAAVPMHFHLFLT